MLQPDLIVPTNQLRSAVSALQARLGPTRGRIAAGWERFARTLDIETDRLTPGSAAMATIVVGPPALVLKHAATTDQEFGCITPVAQLVKRWQRATSWRDDTTLDLWAAGWSPAAIDRVIVPGHDADLEFMVSNVRRTPQVTPPAMVQPDK